VPARVETCYCGQERSALPARAVRGDAALRRFVWSLLAVVLAGAAIAAVTLRRRSPETRVVSTPAPARPPVTIATAAPVPEPVPGQAAAAPAPAVSAPVGSPSAEAEPSAPVESLDDLRDKAAQAFDGGLLQLAGRVETFRSNLRDYENGCRSGGGPWPASGCDALRQDLRQRLDGIRTGLEAMDEDARRASVYPGVRAQLRRRHGLDEDAWDALLRRARETLE
jgi:hypothetical protein